MSRRRKQWILLSMGTLLLVAGLTGAVYWFHCLNPQRKYLARYYVWDDPLWHHRKWLDTQKRIRRFGWWHDDFVPVGQWGGSEWVAWIIERITPVEKTFDCDPGHMRNTLRVMTNQDPGFRAEAWLAWWRENKHKTQVEWIRKGFEKAGISLHTPLTKEDMRALLVLIGNRRSPVVTEDESPRPRWETPWYLCYNAMRWLRDSDFDPLSFTVNDLTGEDGDALLNGLLTFSEWRGINWKWYTPGELPLSDPVEKWKLSAPPITAPWVAAIAYSSLVVLFVAGLLCVRKATRGVESEKP